VKVNECLKKLKKLMKKKFLFFFMLFLFVLGTVILNAQVRIGGDSPPAGASVLDLNVNEEAAPSGNGALALPRVALTSVAMPLNGATPKNGMVIYNVGYTVPGTQTTFHPGVYVWQDGKWVGHSSIGAISETGIHIEAPVITVQPRAFNWKESPGQTHWWGVGDGGDGGTDANGNPKPGVLQEALSITATGFNLSYQWYEVPRAGLAPPSPAPGNNTKATYNPISTNLGMRTYYCIVSNSAGSVKSDIAKVAVGCGALTSTGSWRTFMCYNLGAANISIAEQLAYNHNKLGNFLSADSSNYDPTVYGGLYQWNRLPDGHQILKSPTVGGPYTAGRQVHADSSSYGKFIIRSKDTGDWRDLSNSMPVETLPWRGRYDDSPCYNEGSPSGYNWHVPTHSEWGETFGGGDAAAAGAYSTANTWDWRSFGINGSFDVASGYSIKPDGVTTTLFLPAAGVRDVVAGDWLGPGEAGYYWSRTAYGPYAYFLQFSADYDVDPGAYHLRAYGMSIRCIAEER
jgi:uncharacterized protein (TIGR02145 family)